MTESDFPRVPFCLSVPGRFPRRVRLALECTTTHREREHTWLSCRGGERESHSGELGTGAHPVESAYPVAEHRPALWTEKVASFVEVLPDKGEVQGSAVNQNPSLVDSGGLARHQVARYEYEESSSPIWRGRDQVDSNTFTARMPARERAGSPPMPTRRPRSHCALSLLPRSHRRASQLSMKPYEEHHLTLD